MLSKLFIPKLGMTMEKATIAEWRHRHGDRVEKDAPVLVIDTEKVANEIEAPAAGRLVIAASVGEELPCGAVVGFIAETDEEFAEAARQGARGAPSDASPSAPAPGGEPSVRSAAERPAAVAGLERVKMSPLARRMARAQGIDVAKITGTGPGGRIVRKDVEAAAKAAEPSRGARGDGAAAAPPRGARVDGAAAAHSGSDRVDGAAAPAPAPRVAAVVEGAKRAREVVPLKGIRKVISDHMHLSHSVSAPVTILSEVDMTEMIRFRDRLNQKGAAAAPSVTFTDIFILVAARALRRTPIMNSSLIGNEIVVWDDINIGCAVSIQVEERRNALVVPVVRNADRLSLREISARRKDVTDRARGGRLALDDTAGGTFTITNTGTLGQRWHVQTPLINQPEAAILGTASIVDRPVVVDGSIVVRPVMPVSVTFDHRIMDGAPPAEFLNHVHEMLTDPQMILA